MSNATQQRRRDLLAALRGCQRRLRTFIAGRAGNAADAEDIYQEISYRLFKADSYLHPIEQVGAWLFRAARNELIDHDEDWFAGDELADVLFSRQSSAEDEYLRQLVWRELEIALADMPAPQREAFEKTELQDYSFKQLAEETGNTIETLLSRKHKAVLFLRLRLQLLYEGLTDA
jgi:RNA polymerase sigma factor (sigma-70 family)